MLPYKEDRITEIKSFRYIARNGETSSVFYLQRETKLNAFFFFKIRQDIYSNEEK